MTHRLFYAIKHLSLLFLLTALMLGCPGPTDRYFSDPPPGSIITSNLTNSNTAILRIKNNYLGGPKEFYSINVTGTDSDSFTVSPNVFFLNKGETKDIIITCQGAVGLHKGGLNVEYYKIGDIGQYKETYKLECQVGKTSQTISFDLSTLPTKTYGDAPFDISRFAPSGLPVTFSSTTPNVCTVSGSTITVVGAGRCTIRADKAGDKNYNPALPVLQTFTIQQAR